MNKIINKSLWRVLIASGLIMILAGCVIVPIPMPSKTQASFIERDDLSFIRKGKTSKAEIREQLGRPSQAFEDPSRWIYTLRRYSGNRWAVCVFVGGPGYGDGDCGMASEGTTKYKIIELEFDDADVVTRKNTSSIADGKCTRSGICRAASGFVASAAKRADLSAEEFASSKAAHGTQDGSQVMASE